MSLYDWATALAGGLLLWVALGLAIGIPIGRTIRRADEIEQPGPQDPDATADDDEDSVALPTYPPPVPAPRCRYEAAPSERWDEYDDAALVWFLAGGAAR